jgi:GntR family transcriptional regulator/MocR family aminotransferase
VRLVNCDPEQVFIVSGSRMALQMCALALLESNGTVGAEACTRLSALHGLTALRVPVELIPPEHAGSDDVLRTRISGRIGFVYVTPSHRYLFGPPMSDRYRRQLLRWAEANEAWILEEDYDGDLRHDDRRPVPLHSEGPDRVIYLLTFVRSMFPGLKTHFLVVPPSTVPTFIRVRRAVLGTTLTSHQAALADFVGDGHYARHVRRMRPVYTRRRDALLASLRRHGEGVLTPHSVEAGIDLAVTFTADVHDKDVSRTAAKQGLSTVALSHFYPDRNGLILGFGCSTPQQLDDAAHTLLDIIRSTSRVRPRTNQETAPVALSPQATIRGQRVSTSGDDMPSPRFGTEANDPVAIPRQPPNCSGPSRPQAMNAATAR